MGWPPVNQGIIVIWYVCCEPAPTEDLMLDLPHDDATHSEVIRRFRRLIAERACHVRVHPPPKPPVGRP